MMYYDRVNRAWTTRHPIPTEFVETTDYLGVTRIVCLKRELMFTSMDASRVGKIRALIAWSKDSEVMHGA